MINIISEIEDINKLLHIYKGANLECFLYSITHKRFLLKLNLNNDENIICILTIDCQFFSGAFDLENIEFEVSEINGKFKLKDKNKNFEIVSTSIAILQGNLILDFGIDFQKDFMWIKEG